MRRHLVWMVSLLFSVHAGAAPPPAKDTAQLSTHLHALRGKLRLAREEYRRLQNEYLAWIDSRITAGATPTSMNRELRAAGLFPRSTKVPGPEAFETLYESHAGYLEPISEKTVQTARDVLVIDAEISKGAGCSIDTTAIIYQRRPLKRLAYVNADPGRPQYGYLLSGFDVGKVDWRGERMAASGWVISNCTSTWNGKRIRIDRLKDSSLEQVLARDLIAQDRDHGEDVAARIDGNFVTFSYKGETGDADLLSGPAIARYQVTGKRAVLAAPLALTRAGFIYEWLRMPDADALRWSAPEPAAARKRIASSLQSIPFEWERIAQCGGTPAIWEIAIRPEGSPTPIVFRISGSRAADLRMVGVDHAVSQTCQPEDLSKGLDGVAAELPW